MITILAKLLHHRDPARPSRLASSLITTMAGPQPRRSREDRTRSLRGCAHHVARRRLLAIACRSRPQNDRVHTVGVGRVRARLDAYDAALSARVVADGRDRPP